MTNLVPVSGVLSPYVNIFQAMKKAGNCVFIVGLKAYLFFSNKTRILMQFSSLSTRDCSCSHSRGSGEALHSWYCDAPSRLWCHLPNTPWLVSCFVCACVVCRKWATNKVVFLLWNSWEGLQRDYDRRWLGHWQHEAQDSGLFTCGGLSPHSHSPTTCQLVSTSDHIALSHSTHFEMCPKDLHVVLLPRKLYCQILFQYMCMCLQIWVKNTFTFSHLADAFVQSDVQGRE